MDYFPISGRPEVFYSFDCIRLWHVLCIVMYSLVTFQRIQSHHVDRHFPPKSSHVTSQNTPADGSSVSSIRPSHTEASFPSTLCWETSRAPKSVAFQKKNISIEVNSCYFLNKWFHLKPFVNNTYAYFYTIIPLWREEKTYRITLKSQNLSTTLVCSNVFL